MHALLCEPAGKRLRRVLATAVRVRIKGQIDSSLALAQLPNLARIEMDSQ